MQGTAIRSSQQQRACSLVVVLLLQEVVLCTHIMVSLPVLGVVPKTTTLCVLTWPQCLVCATMAC